MSEICIVEQGGDARHDILAGRGRGRDYAS
jgi:hypothetical protein